MKTRLTRYNQRFLAKFGNKEKSGRVNNNCMRERYQRNKYFETLTNKF
jgi:hypothetical protein